VQKAAEQGLEGAQYSLAALYKEGKGVPKDLVLAYAWFDTSGANGYKEAYKERDALAKEMDAAMLEQAKHTAADYLVRFRAPAR
jgi:TPR repeat protein